MVFMVRAFLQEKMNKMTADHNGLNPVSAALQMRCRRRGHRMSQIVVAFADAMKTAQVCIPETIIIIKELVNGKMQALSSLKKA